MVPQSKHTKGEFIMNRNDQSFVAQKIREQYVEKGHTPADELRELDSRVKRPVTVFGYTFGSISAIIMGGGMSLVMTDLAATLGMGDGLIPGIIIGIIGLIAAIVNYPICKLLLGKRKKKYAKEVLALSDEILKNQ